MATLVQHGFPVTLANAVTTTLAAPASAAGAAVAALPQYGLMGSPRDFAWDVVITGGVVSALAVNLLGSEDGVNWTQIDTYSGTTNTRRDVVDKLPIFVALQIVTLTVTSGTPAVTSKLYI